MPRTKFITLSPAGADVIRRATIFFAVVVIGGVCTALPASATTVVDLGDAANYGILLGQKESATFSGKLELSGNLGIGSNATVKYSGSNGIAGTEYKDSGVKITGSASIAGGAITASMTSAINDAVAAAADAKSLSATISVAGGEIDVSGGSITIKALSNLSVNVLDISSLSLTNGTITFDDNGFTGAKFIVNDTGAFSIKSTGSKSAIIQGINGATAADILFNIEGANSSAVSITGNSSNQIIGTILAPQRNVSLSGGGSLTGALIAGVNNAGKSYTVTEASSGFNITGFAYKPPTGGGGHVPEPSTFVLYLTGLAALIGLRRFRRS